MFIACTHNFHIKLFRRKLFKPSISLNGKIANDRPFLLENIGFRNIILVLKERTQFDWLSLAELWIFSFTISRSDTNLSKHFQNSKIFESKVTKIVLFFSNNTEFYYCIFSQHIWITNNFQLKKFKLLRTHLLILQFSVRHTNYAPNQLFGSLN